MPSGSGGLIPAGNAPRAAPVAPGVQPGTQGQVVATRVIIIGTGGELLVYSPNAGLGTLVASIAAKATTDSYGNAILAGNASYLTGGQSIALSNNGADLTWYSATTSAGPWSVLGELVISPVGPSLVMSGFTNFGLPSGTCPQSSAGITTVAQVVSALVAAGVFD